MQPIYLLDLASRKSAWLAARQAVVASNVANAETPGYRAKDLTPFQDVLAQTQLSLSSSASGTTIDGGGPDALNATPVVQADDFDVAENGNSVGVEREMTKGGEISRDYALTTNITKSFHAMLMASLKA